MHWALLIAFWALSSEYIKCSHKRQQNLSTFCPFWLMNAFQLNSVLTDYTKIRYANLISIHSVQCKTYVQWSWNCDAFHFLKTPSLNEDCLCGLVVRVPGCRTEMHCASCEVRTEFDICYYVEEIRPPLWSSGQSSWLQNGEVLGFLWGTNWIMYVMQKKVDRLCGLVVRVPGYRTEMCCASCEVRTRFIYVM
jgi:hypothetical protein